MSGSHGGARAGAGRKASWRDPVTTHVRVPQALAARVVDVARALDAGRAVFVDSDERLAAIRAARELLASERARLAADRKATPSRVVLGELERLLEEAWVRD